MSRAKAQIQKIRQKVSNLKIGEKINDYHKMQTKGSIGKTAVKTLVETTLGAVAGGWLGYMIGKPGFLIGLGLTSIAHYSGHSWASPFGVGMMATSDLFGKSQKTVNGLDIKGHWENAKERGKDYMDSLMRRTYLDKVFSKKSAKDETTNGIGELSEGEETLRQIEKQLTESANEFSKRNSGTTNGLKREAATYNETDFSRM